MKRISVTDGMFLMLERRQQPMHVAGLQIFTLSPGTKMSQVHEFAEELRQFQNPSAPFDQHIVERRLGNYWHHDEGFDLNHHFRHVALPKPGGIKELLRFVSCEHSNLLDRSRPLWETYLIEGVHGRHFALYSKIHHSLMDGVSAMKLSMGCLSPDPHQIGMPPTWQTALLKSPKKPSTEAAGLWPSLRGAFSVAGTQLGTIGPVVSMLYETIKAARSNPEYANVFRAPTSILNQPITGSRRFVAQSYQRSRLKAIAEKTHSTTNDIILALCGTAIRRYLMSQNCLPEKPLISMVPISLRRDDSIGGNQVGVILANLATHESDPMERLAITKSSVEEAKDKFHRMTREQATNYTALTLAPSGIALFTGRLPQLLAFNVVISNVPGSPKPLYWNGAKLERHYPVSVIVNHMALNITIVGYDGRFEFGIVGCRRTLPRLQRFLDYLDDALEELEQLLGLSRVRKVPSVL